MRRRRSSGSAPDELRELFLFESLDDEQLAWLSENGRVEDRRRGNAVYSEGEPATCFFVLLSGTISMHRRVENTDVETNRTNQRGVYAGATQAFVQSEDDRRYLNSRPRGHRLPLLGDRRSDVRGQDPGRGSRWRCTCWRA